MRRKTSLIVILLVMSIISNAQFNNFDTTQTIFNASIDITDGVINLPLDVPRFDNRNGVDISFLTVNRAKIYVQQEGEGIPLLLIHGGPGGTSHIFHPYFGLAKKYCKIIYYDQRGSGLSEFTGDSTYTLEQSIKDIESLRKALGIEKWFVLGYSFGGALAQYYTYTYPENVLGLVLVSSAIPFRQHYVYNGNQYVQITKNEKEKIFESWDLIDEGKVSESTGLFNAELNGAWKKQGYYKPTKLYAAQTSLYEWHHDNNFNTIMSNEADYLDLTGCFKNCPIPLLIMEGRWDKTWGNNKLEIIRSEFPLPQLHVINNAAHSPFKSNPTIFFNQLKSFVKEREDINSEAITKWKQQATKQFKMNEDLINIEDEFITLLEDEKIETAIKYYDSIKMSNPDCKVFTPLFIINTAYWLATDKNMLQVAIKLFKLCLEEYPETDICHYYLAKLYQSFGDDEQAKIYMEMYTQLTSNRLDYYILNEIRIDKLMETKF